MRHRVKGRGFGRTAEHRRAMMRNMATSLFLHGRVETTREKAKELSGDPKIEVRIVSYGYARAKKGFLVTGLAI